MSSNDSSIPQPASMPDPEVPAKAKRRTFSAAYKLSRSCGTCGGCWGDATPSRSG